MRLVLSVIVCFFAGSFLLAAIHFRSPRGLGYAGVYGLTFASLLCLGGALWLLSREWRFGDGLKRAAFLMGLFYVGLALGAWAAKFSGPGKPTVLHVVISTLSLQGALLLLLGGFLREHKTTWAEAFGLRHQRWFAIGSGFLLACAVTPAAWLLQILSSGVMTKLNLQPKFQEIVQTLHSEQGMAARLLFGAVTLLIAPVAEEVFFRGIAYPWLKSKGHFRLALWGTSLVFAGVHLNLPAFLPLTVLALSLALLYQRTGNLLAPIAAHALFNGANLARFYLEHPLHP